MSLFQPSQEELSKLSSAFPDQSSLAMSGVVIGGEKYFYLSGTDRVSVYSLLCYILKVDINIL